MDRWSFEGPEQSSICSISSRGEELLYRGYSIRELAQRADFERTARLLLNGEWCENVEKLHDSRDLDSESHTLTKLLSQSHHPLDVLQSVMSAWSEKESEAIFERVPTLVAEIYRRSMGKEAVAPDETFGASENFLYMCFGKKPSQSETISLNRTRILYMEHGWNASTFTCRVAASTGVDLNSALTSAISSLKGPRHGGAVENVYRMLERLEGGESIPGFVSNQLQAGQRIPGFGHRIYRNVIDPRYPLMLESVQMLQKTPRSERLLEICGSLIEEVERQKGLKPNLDLISSVYFSLLGFPPEHFLSLIVLGRMVGWTAHYLEQREERRIIRPRAIYNGPRPRVLDASVASSQEL